MKFVSNTSSAVAGQLLSKLALLLLSGRNSG
jgi:hypothetical protein